MDDGGADRREVRINQRRRIEGRNLVFAKRNRTFTAAQRKQQAESEGVLGREEAERSRQEELGVPRSSGPLHPDLIRSLMRFSVRRFSHIASAINATWL